MAAEELRSYLKSVKAKEDETMYDHMIDIVSKLVYDRPSDPVGMFEDYSYQVKKGSGEDDQAKLRYKGFGDQIDKTRKMIDRPKEEGEEGQMVDAAIEPLGPIPDIMGEGEMLKWAGIYFGEEDSYLLQMSLKKLMNVSGASELRFWGKIYGTKSDYYIAEGKGGTEIDIETMPEDFEAKGNPGVNNLTYWATSDLLGEWVELPDILPAQLDIARKIRRLFTGNLEEKIYSNPHFVGQEKHLLRAQIARIYHATTIVPRGQFEGVEDEPQEIADTEDWVHPKTMELASLDAWVHHPQNILKANRLTHMTPVVPEDEEELTEEDLLNAILEKDPMVERIRGIDEDDSLPGFKTAWVHKLCGDKQVYLNSEGERVCYALNVMKSLRWPGAITVQQDAREVSIYVGNGLKGGTETYYPVNPPMVVKDPVDQDEQFEPNPKDPPVIETPPEDAEANEDDA